MVCPRLWYESTLSNTPTFPSEGFIQVSKLSIGSSWANSEAKNPGDQKRLHGPSCSRAWTLTSYLFRLDLNPSFNISFRDMLLHAGWVFGKLYIQIAHVGIDARCPAMNIPIAKRHSPRRLYHPTANEKT